MEKDLKIHFMKITGFYGRKEPIIIRFKKNRLIFVGENGLGKSTIMKMLCYSLTCQFEELKEYIFDEIAIKINNHSLFKIPRVKLLPKKAVDSDEFDHFFIEMMENPRYRRVFVEYRNRMPYSMFKDIARAVFYHDDFIIENIYASSSVSFHQTIQECIYVMRDFREWFYRQIIGRDARLRRNSSRIDEDYFASFKNEIRSEIGDVVFLYLPTYRRIERDSRSIFGDKIKFRDYSVDNYEE